MNAIPRKGPDTTFGQYLESQPITKVELPIEQRLPVIEQTRGKISKLATCIPGLMLLGTLQTCTPAFAKGELSPYLDVADASGGMTLVLKDTGDRIIPPQEIVPLFKRLGHDEKTLVAVGETAAKMQDARSRLGPDVVLGAMVSNSLRDKPKILKDTTNKPEETFTALFGASELTPANAQTVFDRLLNKTQSTGYQKRIAELGAETSQKWFDLFNAVVRKMPTQNVYLLSQALITTSSIYAFNNPALKTSTLSPSLVADQLHRLMLLLTDANFDVARLTYGDTLETAVSRRLPTRDILKQIYGSAGITLPEHLYNIAEAGAREMGIGTESYLTTATKKQDTISNERKATENERKATENEKMADLIKAISELYDRNDTNLQAFIKNPKDSVLLENIRQDMIRLRNLRTKLESLPKEQKNNTAYTDSMELLKKIEKGIKIVEAQYPKISS